MRYDADSPPDAAAWLKLAEGERLALVKGYHKRAGLQAGSPEVHASIHVAVETQLAEGLASATDAMERLSNDGLDRHEALHAIGSVLAEELFGVLRSEKGHDPERYDRALSKLTAAGWRAKYRE
jgi:hypothetical protein